MFRQQPSHAVRPLLFERMIEGAWLAALVVMPILFHPHSATIFEPDKAAVLRALSLLVLVAATARLLRSRSGFAESLHGALRSPIGLAATAGAASYLLSTALSVDPHLSLWGSYDRRQGLLSFLAYLSVFGAVFALLRSEGQLRRLLQTLVVASVPVSLYALYQVAGLDPMGWIAATGVRPSANAGNPIFLGAHLIMVVPVTLALGLAALLAPGRRIEALGYSAVLLLQVVAVGATGSRGPLLGLAVAIAFFGLVVLRRAPRRVVLAGLAALAGAAALLALLVVPGGPLESVRSRPVVRHTVLGRLAGTLDFGEGTVAVRLRLWEGMIELVGEEPARLLTGYGPETLGLTHHRHYEAGLASLENPDVAADRAHNRSFDLLATRGIPGLLADLALFGALVYTVLAASGIPPGRRRRCGAAAALGAGGGAVASLVAGIPALLGPLPALGAVAGLLLFLAFDLLWPTRAGADKCVSRPELAGGPSGVDLSTLALAALAAGALGHFAETQLGIATVTTRLYLWTSVGVIAVLGQRSLVAPTGNTPPERDPREGFAWGVVLALTLVTSTFGFVVARVDGASLVPLLIVTATGTLLFGLLTLVGTAGGRRGVALGTSLGLFGPILTGQILWRHRVLPETVEPDTAFQALMTQVDALGWALPAFTGTIFLLTGVFAVVRAGRRAGLFRDAAVAGACLAAAAVPAWTLSLDPVRVDVVARTAMSFENRGDGDTAARLYRIAADRLPREPRYAAFLAWHRRASARREVGNPERRAQLLDEALTAARETRRRRPEDPRFLVLLAQVHADRGSVTRNSDSAAAHFARADDAFREAVEAAPRRPATRMAWARSLLDRGRARAAAEQLETARALDESFAPVHRLLGEAYLAAGRWEASRDAYRRAIELGTDDAATWRGLASALAQLDARAEAANAYLEAVDRGANDVLTYRNLALMLGELGRVSEAIPWAERALEVAPPRVEEDVRGLLEQLREISAAPPR